MLPGEALELVYLIGPPAAGKSTLMAALTQGCARRHVPHPIGHDELLDGATGARLAVELGRRRPSHPGTDALPMNVAPAARSYLAGRPAALVLAEGDRLAHLGFLDAASRAGYRVTAVYLEVPERVLDARCVARGTTQNGPWRTGRATKARNLAAAVGAAGWPVVTLDATRPPEALARQLREAVPALRELPAP